MKKISIALLCSLLLIMQQSWGAEVIAKNNLHEQQVFIIDNVKIHYVKITNNYPTYFGFLIHVNETFIKNNKQVPSDRVKLACLNDLYLEPGQTARCVLPKYQHALITIDPNNFINGSEIVYIH